MGRYVEDSQDGWELYDDGHAIFFFSSRRRHTRCSRDWSSDVCSSDLLSSTKQFILNRLHHSGYRKLALSSLEEKNSTNAMIKNTVAVTWLGTPGGAINVRSEERRVGKSVDLGGRRIIKKKKTTR